MVRGHPRLYLKSSNRNHRGLPPTTTTTSKRPIHNAGIHKRRIPQTRLKNSQLHANVTSSSNGGRHSVLLRIYDQPPIMGIKTRKRPTRTLRLAKRSPLLYYFTSQALEISTYGSLHPTTLHLNTQKTCPTCLNLAITLPSSRLALLFQPRRRPSLSKTQ